MYFLDSKISTVRGIGDLISANLLEKKIHTIADLLLNLPLRYEDFSHITTISELKNLEVNQPITLKARVISSSQFYKNRKSILSATIEDETGKTKCAWFNNKFLAPVLKQAENSQSELFFSGKVNNNNSLTQPTVEKSSDSLGEKVDTIHTGRLVPIYSSTLDLKQGKLRRLLKEILDNLEIKDDFLELLDLKPDSVLDLKSSFYQAHFPDNNEKITLARERFALEELLALISESKRIKKTWQKENKAEKIVLFEPQIPDSIPFELTSAQKKSTQEIIADLNKKVAMNRLLVGDVGSGKTIVAGIACNQVLKNGHNVALVAPTQILANQHLSSLKNNFPDLKIELITSQNSAKFFAKYKKDKAEPTFFVGTHALINKFEKISPTLIIFDEQHRFGVEQRSQSLKLKTKPHVLTMTATPIPRSLMLTIFSHLEVSIIDEMPKNRKPVKTWVVPEKKREASFAWITEQLEFQKGSLAIVVCPFIDNSDYEALENIASAKDTFEKVKTAISKNDIGKKLKVELLHGKLDKIKKEKIMQDLFDQKINVLVTTPIVEVGIDLPAANIIIIESSERFGLASLHQLRGRVGRAGQESYCLLFNSSPNKEVTRRLDMFSRENNGIKLAEMDLKNRGAGSIFGTLQSGFSSLRFASWNNLELIKMAQEISQTLEKKRISPQLLIKNDTQKRQMMAN
jgi:ATP-dependent DNA helicase RecG